MNYRGCLLLCVTLLGGFAPLVSVSAQDLPAELTAVQELEAILLQTRTFSARVEQLFVDQDSRELQETSARLLMAKPAKFSWEVTAPYAELMVTDGTLIWRYEPDLDQVSIQHFNDELDRTPIMLLNGDAESIASAYDVSSVTMDEVQLKRFILQPRNPGSLFERMALTFSNNDLVEMQFEDSRGQQTSLSFHDIERNAHIDPESFHFTPPAGVEIIDTTLE